MKTMKQIVVAVSLVVISAMAPIAEAQQGVEKVAPGTLVAPAEALNSILNSTESQMISLVKAMPADKYGFAPSGLIFGVLGTKERRVRLRHWLSRGNADSAF
jgi:hypothetical protein